MTSGFELLSRPPLFRENRKKPMANFESLTSGRKLTCSSSSQSYSAGALRFEKDKVGGRLEL